MDAVCLYLYYMPVNDTINSSAEGYSVDQLIGTCILGGKCFVYVRGGFVTTFIGELIFVSAFRP